MIKVVIFLAIRDRVGLMPLVGSKGKECVEGSHIGVNEPTYTLFCVARGWWCPGSRAAA